MAAKLPGSQRAASRKGVPLTEDPHTMSSEQLDDFQDVSEWMPVASGQARLDISRDRGTHGAAMRLDFDFHGGGGFVVARKRFPRPMPEAYAFEFRIRAEAPQNRFEFKLIDPSGDNVWWYKEDAFAFEDAWRTVRIRSSQIDFAWGPAGGGSIAELATIEFAIAAGRGGRGTVWIEALRLEDCSFRSIPAVRASSAIPGHEPERAVDRDERTSWRSDPRADPSWFSIDFQTAREYGGLIIRWDPVAPARGFDVQTSPDGADWSTVYSAKRAAGECSYVYLPNTTSRYLRLILTPRRENAGVGIAVIDVKPHDFSRSVAAFFHSVAAAQRRGRYPKYLSREQTYWTPVGVCESVTRALLNEEGLLEVDEGSFSIEPFLYVDGALVTWADVVPTQELEQGFLPIPSSVWRTGGLTLRITAFATADAAGAVLYVRYRIENAGDRVQPLRLFAALRPLQVTPPWQAFKQFGGISPIRELVRRGPAVWVNRAKAVVSLVAPDDFGAAVFDEGPITEYLEEGGVPASSEVADEMGLASAALRYDRDVAPGGTEDVYLAIAFASADATQTDEVTARLLGRAGPQAFAAAVAEWQSKLAAVDMRVPAAAAAGVRTFKSAAAHILINREGPALQPGPRRYTRCWIRDGAIMAAALLRAGCTHEVRDFVRWYAPYQAPDGNVPCCVDRDGPDWLPEYDSLGELIYTVMEYYRFTGDRPFLQEMWRTVLKTVDFMETLRNRRLTPEFQTPEKRACYGLLPESASHEGYLAHHVHAYWDDFWALRGLRDAAQMATVIGENVQAERIAALRDSLHETLYASIRATIAERKIDYVPGSVEWADFDPTATANAIALLDESSHLPAAALAYTFDEYLAGFRKKHSGEIAWANYTPYEIRIIGALVRLGRREEAQELLNFFLADRRPLAWNQWPEIAWRDPTAPGHLGDLPHSWISAEYMLSFRSLFAYERDADQVLVVAAGVSDEWIRADGGVAVDNLPTWFGSLSYSLTKDDDGTIHFRLGEELRLPPGGVVLLPPADQPIRAVTANGVPSGRYTPTQVIIGEVPAEVVVEY